MEPGLESAPQATLSTCSARTPSSRRGPAAPPFTPLFSESPCPARPCARAPLSPNPRLRPLLTCSPARCPAATPWRTAPSAPTGPRSLVGPSEDDSHTTAAGRGGYQAPALRSPAQRGRKGQAEGAGRSKGPGAPWWGGADRGKESGGGVSYHLYPDVGGEGLLSLVLGYRPRYKPPSLALCRRSSL